LRKFFEAHHRNSREGWITEGTTSREFTREMGEVNVAPGGNGQNFEQRFGDRGYQGPRGRGNFRGGDNNFNTEGKGTMRDNRTNKQGESNSLIFDRT
jgi:hypothetical protein